MSRPLSYQRYIKIPNTYALYPDDTTYCGQTLEYII